MVPSKLLVEQYKMAGPCVFLAVGVLVCTMYNGLHLLRDKQVTESVVELELKGLDEDEMFASMPITYDQGLWSKLEILWIGRDQYRCVHGFCYNEDASTEKMDSTKDNDEDEDDGIVLTDVGVILIIVIAVIVLVGGGVVGEHCKIRQKLASVMRNIRRGVRGGITLDDGAEMDTNTVTQACQTPSILDDGAKMDINAVTPGRHTKACQTPSILLHPPTSSTPIAPSILLHPPPSSTPVADLSFIQPTTSPKVRFACRMPYGDERHDAEDDNDDNDGSTYYNWRLEFGYKKRDMDI